jgi:hypothetical protein
VPDDPAEIGLNRVLTREPDTASTVGGKDAHMGYARGIALHLDGFAMRFLFLAPFCREFPVTADLLLSHKEFTPQGCSQRLHKNY